MPSPPSLLPLLAVAALALAPATAQRTATAAAATAASRPTLTLYGEALCPDTAAYVTRVLAPLLDSGLVGVGAGGAAAPSPPTAEFRFVGYGNAKGRAPGSVKCQHGKEECALNRALNCAQSLAPSTFPSLLTCYFGGDLTRSALDACLTARAGPDASPAAVKACASGPAGDALETAAADDTAGLAPRNTFVPWVTVDGVALAAACGDTARYVCVAAAARGTARLPAACEDAAGAPPARCPGAPTAGAGGVFGG